MRYPLCYTAVFLLSGPAIKYKTNYQRARVYINVGIYKGYKARASRWIRIVKFGPINSGKSFNLNRTLTLARGGFGAWSAGGWRSNGWRVIAGLLLKYSETRGNRATATAFYHRARPVKTVKHTTDAPLFRPEKHLFYIIRDSREEISLSLSPSHFFSFTRTHTSIYPFGLCVQFYQVALPDYDGRCTTWIVIDNDFYPFRFDAPPYTGHRGGFTRPCSRFARVCTTVDTPRVTRARNWNFDGEKVLAWTRRPSESFGFLDFCCRVWIWKRKAIESFRNSTLYRPIGFERT